MKRLLAITAVMLGQSAMAGWYTGYELKGFAENHDKISNGTSDINTDRFQAGIFFGFVLGTTNSLEGQGLLCLPSSIRAGQIIAIVAKFLKDNPETWNQSGESIVFTSMSRTFPCKK